MEIIVKRIYEAPAKEDGYRILIDRLWPRGLSKEEAVFDEWDKEIAPSTVIRKLFHHDASNFMVFTHQYRNELSHNENEVTRLRNIAKKGKLCLLVAAKDPKYNHGNVLKDYLLE